MDFLRGHGTINIFCTLSEKSKDLCENTAIIFDASSPENQQEVKRKSLNDIFIEVKSP
jgi:hypothetical protein